LCLRHPPTSGWVTHREKKRRDGQHSESRADQRNETFLIRRRLNPQHDPDSLLNLEGQAPPDEVVP
jgi:hypothetical protein